ncbi:hypothetical protein ACFPRL_21950 [Pseudoclavibacter helvolus]
MHHRGSATSSRRTSHGCRRSSLSSSGLDSPGSPCTARGRSRAG